MASRSGVMISRDLDDLTERSFSRLAIEAEFYPPLRSTEPNAVSQIPIELIIDIVELIRGQSFSEKAQANLAKICRISKIWYVATVPLLYERPWLKGWRFLAFANTVCPSINPGIRKSDLADYVKYLWMNGLVHESTRSLTARVLGRTSRNMESFIAPQASFGINAFAALAKCQRLQFLRLDFVSEAVSLTSLYKTLSQLPTLKQIALPCCRLIYDIPYCFKAVFPSQLEHMEFSIGYEPCYLENITMPKSLGTIVVRNDRYLRPNTTQWEGWAKFAESIKPQLTEVNIGDATNDQGKEELMDASFCSNLFRLGDLPKVTTYVAMPYQFLADPPDFRDNLALEHLKIKQWNRSDHEADQRLIEYLYKGVRRGLLSQLKQIRLPSTINLVQEYDLDPDLTEDLAELQKVNGKLRIRGLDLLELLENRHGSGPNVGITVADD